jgi:putative ABC transport system permease protein
VLKLALRNIWRHGLRSVLTLAAIALGVAGLILAGGFVEDVFVQLGEATIHSQLGHLQVFRAGYYTKGARKPLEFAIRQPRELLARIRENPNVDDAMLRLDFSALLSNGRTDLAVTGQGIEPEREARLGTHVKMLQGRYLNAQDRYGALIGEGVARKLGLSPGDSAVLVGTTTDGGLNNVDLTIVGVFRSFSKDYDNRTVRIQLAAAQDLLGADIANAAVVLLKQTSATRAAQAALRQSLGTANVEVKAWDELSDFYAKTIALYDRQFGVLQIIVTVMVVLSVMNSVSLTTYERAGEFGTMRALGDTGAHVFRLLILENAFVGIIGALIGLVLGCALAWLVSEIGIPMPPPPNAEAGYTAFIRIVPSIVVTACAIGLFATLAATLIPGHRVTRMPVAEALRQNV